MATYYISTSGNNGNAGTLASPWRNLSYACSTVITSGNIIHVLPGTFNETSQCNLRVGVSIEGDGITSIIRSQVGGTSYTISLYSDSEGTNGNQHISNLKFDGTSLTAYGAISVWRRSNVWIYNCTFVDFNYYGLYFQGGYAGSGLPPTTYATGNKVYNCTINNCSGYFPAGDKNNGEGKGAIMPCGQDGMLIHDNILTQTSRPAGSNGYLIKAVGYGLNKGLKIYNNTITKAPYDNQTWDFALEIWSCRGGCEIYNNTILGGAIDISGRYNTKGSYAYSVWIHNNIIGNTTLSQYENTVGLFLEREVSDLIIEKNLIKNVCTGIYFPTYNAAGNISKIDIRYNILYNIGVNDSGSNGNGWGINWYNQVLSVLNNVNIWNNVIIGSTGSKTNRDGMNLPAIGTTTNVSIRNNIITNFDHTPIYGYQEMGSETLDVLSIENNIFHDNGNGNAVLYSGLTPTNNTTQNNLTSDPLFVSSSDFHLQVGSDGIDGGLDVGLLYDYEDYPVTDPPNIGAYEAGSSPVVSPAPPTPPIPVTSVTVVGEGSRTVINVDNGTLQMYALVLPANADDTTVTWSVINGTGSATISASGLLTAVSNGTVTVKATSNG